MPPLSSTPLRGDGQAGPLPRLARSRTLPRLGPGPTVLVIGYPSRASARIVEEVLASDTRTVACVVTQDRMAEARSLREADQGAGRLHLFAGSAALPGLGLPHTAWRILDTAEEIYGVASASEIATGHIQDFAAECPRLRALHLIATDSDSRATPPSGMLWGSLRRTVAALAAQSRARSAVGTLTSMWSRMVTGIARSRPIARPLRSWKDLIELDIEAALSWEDIERDLRPGRGT